VKFVLAVEIIPVMLLLFLGWDNGLFIFDLQWDQSLFVSG
jgi:hypothetical protein